jgi:PDZ domain-containing protein
LATVVAVVGVTLVVVVAGAAAVVAGVVPCGLLTVQPHCEVALLPGPTEDTVGLVAIDGARTYPSAGELLLTTVAVRDDLDLAAWWEARRSPQVETVARETIYPPGSEDEDVAEQNALLMQDSQMTAAIAALAEAGYDVASAASGATIAGIEPDAATDELGLGDVVVAVDGQPVTEAGEVVAAVGDRAPGERLELEVRATDGAPRTVPVTLAANPADPNRAYIGVLLTTELDLPVDVAIDAGVIGGPSAGLMFALGVVELLGEEDLTGGAVVAGTGTITAEGTIGRVGAVRQKVIAASERTGGADAATAFLVPRADLTEARDAPVGNDLLLVPVDDLGGAVDALADLRAGREPVDALALSAGSAD